jgi:hypothetical protein
MCHFRYQQPVAVKKITVRFACLVLAILGWHIIAAHRA